MPEGPSRSTANSPGSPMIAIAVLAAWPLVSLVLYAVLGPRRAWPIVLFGGWALLPSTPPLQPEIGSLPGVALPAYTVITKAAAVGTGLLLGIVCFDRNRLAGFRFRIADVFLAAFLVSPLPGGLIAGRAGAAAAESLYLCVAWGGPWIAGRIGLRAAEDFRDAARLLVLIALFSLPFLAAEFVAGPFWYEAIYGRHTYTGVGEERFLGHRPMLLLEDGNQLGLWLAAAALAAAALAQAKDRAAPGPAWWPAVALGAATVAAQSVGAILLYGVGLSLVLVRTRRARRILLGGAAAVLLAWIAVRAAGLVSFTDLAKKTAVGQAVRQGLKDAGLGSFGWRLKQEEKHLGAALERPTFGRGKAKWWEDDRADRPWGLWLLVLGGYGAVGLLALTGALVLPLLHAPRRTCGLAAVLFAAVADSLLNSTFWLPAAAVAGGFALRRFFPEAEEPSAHEQGG